jgi:hypothetical protein
LFLSAICLARQVKSFDNPSTKPHFKAGQQPTSI